MPHPWIAKRSAAFDSSGIRKVFDLAATMANPINLSIGQPDFPVPEEIQEAAIAAIRGGKNSYSVTQGIAELREALQARVDAEYGHDDRRVAIISGTSGGLVLATLAMIDPGDEVIILDPYFVMYPALVKMAGGTCVFVDTYPDFRLPLEKIEAAITPRTKLILLNSPANPTGAVASANEVAALARLAEEKNVALLSDEIYRLFCYDAPFASPAATNPQTIVIDGFSKSHAMTGWRLGFVHGPAAIVNEMMKLQQYTFVCAPQPAQWAALAALETDMSAQIADYHRRRDLLLEGLAGRFELAAPGGAFYAFPRAPWGTGTEFVRRAIQNELLIIPGNIFSAADTHFRISYAADTATLERGIEVLQRLADEGE
ncbi:MAG: aminotransferase class I/II-fold pyridoxal phosphate-dependent enzyme [Planctomycetales bacterium]|nr:aminotransferase class I/II-fold pyridoxal phosphate-dependent enzyme [Planctomycetales bacterium]